MPSTYQHNNDYTEYPSEPMKMLATKNELTIEALIRGMDTERAHEYIQAELDLAEREDREPRRHLIGKLNQRITRK